MTMFPSRAQNLGIKPKVLAARTMKSIALQRERLTQLALPYAEVDNSVESSLQDLLAAFDTFAAHIKDTTQWLEQQPGS